MCVLQHARCSSFIILIFVRRSYPTSFGFILFFSFYFLVWPVSLRFSYPIRWFFVFLPRLVWDIYVFFCLTLWPLKTWASVNSIYVSLVFGRSLESFGDINAKHEYPIAPHHIYIRWGGGWMHWRTSPNLERYICHNIVHSTRVLLGNLPRKTYRLILFYRLPHRQGLNCWSCGSDD